MSTSRYGRRIAQAVLSLTLIAAPPLSADTPSSETVAAKAQHAATHKPQAYPAQAVQVSRAVGTRALRTGPRVPAWAPGKPIRYVPKRVYPKPAPGNPRNQPTWRVDPLLEIQERGSTTRQQVTSGRGQISAPNVNETGLPFTGAYPPDTVGDVGPTRKREEMMRADRREGNLANQHRPVARGDVGPG